MTRFRRARPGLSGVNIARNRPEHCRRSAFKTK
jgi:hypothetical protein